MSKKREELLKAANLIKELKPVRGTEKAEGSNGGESSFCRCTDCFEAAATDDFTRCF